MSDATHRVWVGDRYADLPVASMRGEALVVPAVAAIVLEAPDLGRMVLQRRDKAGEATRGLLEIPTGRWRAGEDLETALAREVAEETGLVVRSVLQSPRRVETVPQWQNLVLDPVAVTVGVEGAYPALVLAFTCTAQGEPRPEEGWTSDPRWVPIAEVEAMLQDSEMFTAPAYGILTTWLGR
jgi:8-oxo-dGTP pyrophosphatase MutT (NUDIX family)